MSTDVVPFCGCIGFHTPGGCPVEPFPFEQPPPTSADLAHIRADIHAWDHDDRHCLPQLFAKALGFIESRATEGDPQAIQTLRVMAIRSTSGIPFGEPAEPAWSLDPEPHSPSEPRDPSWP